MAEKEQSERPGRAPEGRPEGAPRGTWADLEARRGLCLHVVLWAAGVTGGYLLEEKCRGWLRFKQRIPAQPGFVLVTPATPRCGAGSQPQHR